MNKKMLVCLFLLFLLPAASFALDTDRFFCRFSYGRFLNSKLINTAPAENGNALTASYGYNFSDKYALQVELSYCMDDNVLNAATSVLTQVQTCAILNINNIHQFNTFGKFRPYLSVGTALYGANVLIRQTNSFSMYRSYVFADFNYGIGSKYKLNDEYDLYADLVIHSVVHAAYNRAKIPCMLSFGLQGPL